MPHGNKITLDQAQLLDLVGVQAGFLAQIYGKIKNGKTYLATTMAIEVANQGQVVYVNWPIEWNGYDEREHFRYQLLGFLGVKKQFKKYPKTNLRFADLSNLDNVKINGVATGLNFYDWFASLTSCSCFFDEGHIYYDSYLALKMDMSKRLAILETAHYDRSVYVISQRASAIHAVLRGNINIFYKCEKTYEGWFGTRFRRIEFQETGTDEKPNEERVTITNLETGEKTYGDYVFAESIKKYWGKKNIFSLYNSKYRRLGAKESQQNDAEIYNVSWNQNIQNILNIKERSLDDASLPRPPVDNF
jgi:hypothetical protein